MKWLLLASLCALACLWSSCSPVEAAIHAQTRAFPSKKTIVNGSTRKNLGKTLKIQDLWGEAMDSSAKRIQFKPDDNDIFDGRFTFKLPSGVSKGDLKRLLIRVNVRAPPHSEQIYSLKIYDYNKDQWRSVGETPDVDRVWTQMDFMKDSKLGRYVNEEDNTILLQWKSTGPKKMKLDFFRVIFDIDQCDGTFDPILIQDGTDSTDISFNVQGADVTARVSFPDDELCLQDGQWGYPAVILLHGSGGMWKDDDPGPGVMSSQNRAWEEMFNEHCYIGVYVDSFEPRGVSEFKSQKPPDSIFLSPAYVRPRDAHKALEVIRHLRRADTCEPLVHADNVAVMGFSHGGSTTISSVYDNDDNYLPDGWEWQQSTGGVDYTAEDGVLKPAKPTRSNLGSFVAASAHYPGAFFYRYFGNPCNTPEEDGDDVGVYLNDVPLMMHLATEDGLYDNAVCLAATIERNRAQEKRAPPFIKHIYAGADHGFDNGDEGGIDEAANDLARTRVFDFFAQYLH